MLKFSENHKEEKSKSKGGNRNYKLWEWQEITPIPLKYVKA